MNSLSQLKDPQKGKIRSEAWLKQAKFDLDASRISFDNKYYEWSTYQSEQAVEKSLKAVILAAGFIPPKIHKLAVLMGYCNRINEVFRSTRFNFRDLDSFTFISRYPFIIPGRGSSPHEQITIDDAQKLLEQANDFVLKIESIIKFGEAYSPEKSEAYEFDLSFINLYDRLNGVIDNLLSVFDIERIVLFGSYAKEFIPKSATTIDLLIIANTDQSFISRIQKARDATRGGQPSIEPLVYTEEEFKYMTEEEGEGLLEIAVDEGKLIYEKDKGKILEKIKK